MRIKNEWNKRKRKIAQAHTKRKKITTNERQKKKIILYIQEWKKKLSSHNLECRRRHCRYHNKTSSPLDIICIKVSKTEMSEDEKKAKHALYCLPIRLVSTDKSLKCIYADYFIWTNKKWRRRRRRRSRMTWKRSFRKHNTQNTQQHLRCGCENAKFLHSSKSHLIHAIAYLFVCGYVYAHHTYTSSQHKQTIEKLGKFPFFKKQHSYGLWKTALFTSESTVQKVCHIKCSLLLVIIFVVVVGASLLFASYSIRPIPLSLSLSLYFIF